MSKEKECDKLSLVKPDRLNELIEDLIDHAVAGSLSANTWDLIDKWKINNGKI